MFRRFKYAPLAAVLAFALPQVAGATTVLTLDPFTGSTFKSTTTGPTRDTIQSGSMMGGFRLSRLILAPHAFKQTATLQGRSAGPLIVSNGYKGSHRIELRYGVDGTGANWPMNFDMSSYDRVVLTLDGQSTALNINVVLYSNNGATYVSHGRNIDLDIVPHRVEFRFAEFTGGAGFDLHDVDYAVVVIQSASAVGGDDYGVVRLEAEGP